MIVNEIAASINQHKRNRAQVFDGSQESIMQALAWWRAQSERRSLELTCTYNLCSLGRITEFYWNNPIQNSLEDSDADD